MVKALDEWTGVFNTWAENHIGSSPQKVGASDCVMIARCQSPYREEARNSYPTVHKMGRLLIIECRDHHERPYEQGDAGSLDRS